MKNKNDIKNVGFVNLRIHSSYSLLEGALQIDKIIERAVSDYQPAIAITDTNNLFGALEFSKKCITAGVQPIVGCQIAIDFQEDNFEGLSVNQEKRKFFNIILLASTDEGYYNLVHLVSSLYLKKKDHLNSINISIKLLKSFSNGIIALSGGKHGPLDQAYEHNSPIIAIKRLSLLYDIFQNRFYIELQRYRGYNSIIENKLIDLAYSKKIPIVATNEAFFLNSQNYEAHDALLAIAEGKVLSDNLRRRETPDHYLKTRKEMVELFSDLPEALDNTIEIARRCHTCTPIRDPILPHFIKDENQNELSLVALENKEIVRQAYNGLHERLNSIGCFNGYTKDQYEDRLRYEISIITRMNFSSYFLIVSDFIKWAKNKKIPVGPGRGSGSGSLVAYALKITEIDPLRFSLLFERFLNPDRVSMPDFDIDFCQERREEIIQYVQQKYGYDKVSQIITFGTLQARAVLRDVGRVLEIPYTQINRLSKLIPFNPSNPISLSKAINEEKKFQEEVNENPIIGRLIKISKNLEGLYRHTSIHAAGIVISDKPLHHLIPMYYDQKSEMLTTQFNMKDIEESGLVKFDFLGLKTLTILKNTVQLVERRNIFLDFFDVSLSDSQTYRTLSKGETVGIFQVESAGMRKALLGMQPDKIEDIIALIALYRPGPIDNISKYNLRKKGKETITSIHPKIDFLLRETQGVILYQEQVMKIAQVLSGYSLAEADILRRAMGKKNHLEMQKQRIRFIDGAIKNGVIKEKANSIFDLLAKFADYGFNKSHATAYAFMTYQTAYLKTHYPVEFLAASMTHDISNIERLNDFRVEAEKLGILIIPPSVQTSFHVFEVDNKKIYYSLSAIKGIGELAVNHIVSCRGNKHYRNLIDFCQRTDPHIINRRVWESLINSGALDCFKISREILIKNLTKIQKHSTYLKNYKNSNQIDIFNKYTYEEITFSPALPWSRSEKLNREFQSIGYYLSSHPLNEYKKFLENSKIQTWSYFSNNIQRFTSGWLAGTVTGKKIRKTRSGKKMGIFQLSDTSGQYEIILFSEELSEYSDFLEIGKSIMVMVKAEKKLEGIILRLQRIKLFEEKQKNYKSLMKIYLKSPFEVDEISKILQEKQNGGKVNLILIQENRSKNVEIELNKKFAIDLYTITQIRNISGVIDIKIL